MGTTNTQRTGSHTTKSELEKFALFYESVPVKAAKAAPEKRTVRR